MLHRSGFWICLAVALASAAWAYAPGLHGGFLFDDFANLPALGSTGPVDNAAGFWRYVTSGRADPTGRPVALLSFLVDARDWPADPLPFKRTNLAIHLINIALLALLLRRLSGFSPGPLARRAGLVSVAGAALWGLHPLMVSTTLYAVQREAMLPATFVLLGLLCWIHGRERLTDRRPFIAAVWMLGGTAAFTVLAVLSKANGILLPLLVGVLELSVLRTWRPVPATHQAPYRKLCMAVIALPSGLLLLYLVWTGISLGGADLSGTRPWSVAERLMTQPRVLIDYLTKLIVPRPYTSGLFNDAYVVSKGLLQPPSTLLALIVVLALPAWAIWQRQRYPLLAAAVLFYFAGHLLESTTIPLELYFEHRNYLPAMLLGWPLCAALLQFRPAKAPAAPDPDRPSVLSLIVIGLSLAGLAVMTHARASLWKDPLQQALVWGALNPNSGRAQAYAAQAEVRIGQVGAAIARLEKAAANAPGELQLALTLIDAHCATGSVPAKVVDQAEAAFLQTRNPGGLIVGWTENAIAVAVSGRCAGIDLATIERLLKAAETNPLLRKTRGRVQDILHLRGLIALQQGQVSEAATLFKSALKRNPRPELALKQAALLGSMGAPAQALDQLDTWTAMEAGMPRPEAGMPVIHAWVLARQQYWPQEISHMRKTLLEEMNAQREHRATSAEPIDP